MKVDWDVRKAATNLRKHGVSFEEAASVLFSDFAITTPDVKHSDEGDARERTIGISQRLRVLVVVHTERVDGLIRIISARKATRQEASDYAEEVKIRFSQGQE